MIGKRASETAVGRRHFRRTGGLFFAFFLTFLFIPFLSSAQCNPTLKYTENWCFGDSVEFSIQGNADSVLWSFGDTLAGIYNSDKGLVVKHQFSDTGSYDVSGIVYSGTCVDTLFQKVRIVNKAVADFDFTNPCLGLATSFFNKSVLDSNDYVVQYGWSFGDGYQSIAENPGHVYSGDSTVTIRLIISTAHGCRDTTSKSLKVKAAIGYTAGLDSVCQRGKVKFSSTYGTDKPVAWQWDFGDSTTSSEENPIHQYERTGFNRYSLKLIYADSTSCFLQGDSVFVRKLPDAVFEIQTDTVQCFLDNETCIRFAKGGNPLKIRNVVWDDGATTSIPLNDSTYCHSFLSPEGGTYRIAYEVVDIYGCASSYKTQIPVKIHNELRAGYEFSIAGNCFEKTALITNHSNRRPQAIESFLWEFGDGSSDSVSWWSVSHKYTRNGIFRIRLTITDTLGCTHTFQSPDSIENNLLIIDARVTDTLSNCGRSNLFRFEQTYIKDADVRWEFGDGSIGINFIDYHSYDTLGHFRPRITVTKDGCQQSQILDTVTVYGPRAEFTARNRFQCQILDTVYLNNISTFFGNDNVLTSWSVNDPLAPDIIMDSKLGHNTDSNANFSVDSASFKHWFTPGFENCYRARLILTDTILGCSDSFEMDLPLAPPQAGPVSPFGYTGARPCLGPELEKTIVLDLLKTQPSCGRERFYVMWDSLCAEQTGNFDGQWEQNIAAHNYNYNDPRCDSSGEVTIGLIIENGKDSFGQTCRDTAFFHHIFQFGEMDPTFASDYDVQRIYCPGDTLQFYFLDTIQDSLSMIVWDFGDSSTPYVASNLDSVSHIFTQNGEFWVVAKLVHNNGCVGEYKMLVTIGVEARYLFIGNELCVGDSIPISNTSVYYRGYDFGALSGVNEVTRWDLGDGKGFSKTGHSVYLDYDRIGDYNIRMEYSNELGCIDTIEIPRKARAFSVFAEIEKPGDTLICDQSVQLFSRSQTYEDTSTFRHFDDYVVSRIWNFSGSSSALTDPIKYFDRGMNVFRLAVENSRGCTDTITDSIFIITPTAGFVMLSDTSGCQPHFISLQNTSKNGNSYTWYFKNAANNIFNTDSNGVAEFTYEEYGLFLPELVAEASMTRANGTVVTCQDTFRYDEQGTPSLGIEVFEKPVVQFSYSTDCNTFITSFVDNTVLITANAGSYLWTFGDGDSSTLKNPQHQYADTGVYRVILRITTDNGCIDSLETEIVISPQPIADFSFTEACLGGVSSFRDQTTTYNDRVYRWRWEFGDGVIDVYRDPNHMYMKDSTYKVRLIATNRAGCSDSVLKDVRVFETPTVDFMSNNACERQKVNFTNQSTTKQDTILCKWNFGDQGTSEDKDPGHIYTQQGTFQVKLVVTTDRGCSDSIVKPVEIFPVPQTRFDVNSLTQCLNENRFDFTNATIITGDSIKTYQWQTSAGDSVNTLNFSKVFTSSDSFGIDLWAETYHGCRDTFRKTVVVLESPEAGIQLSSDSTCAFDGVVVLNDLSLPSGNIQYRKWFIDTVLKSIDSSFTTTFDLSGKRDITLIAEHFNGCADTVSTQVQVEPKPTAGLVIPVTEQCLIGNFFAFGDSSSVQGDTLRSATWYFGNGDSSLLKLPGYSYGYADTFTVTLIATTKSGCRDTVSNQVIVHPHPMAAFTVDTTSLCLRDNLFSFTNGSTIHGTQLSYKWYFDGDSSMEVNPEVSFSGYGTQTVVLIAESTFGCKDSIRDSVEVYPMPVAEVSINDTAQCLNDQDVVFTDISQIPYGVLSRKWLLWNGTTDTAKQSGAIFNSPGTYSHRLVSISDKFCTDTIAFSHSILPLPDPGFYIDDSSKCPDRQPFVFNAIAGPETGIAQYLWNFGDGNSDTIRNPEHRYSSSGKYGVVLVATSDRQCKDTADVEVEVYHKPAAVLLVNDSAQCLNQQDFQFTGASTIAEGSIVGFEWGKSGQSFKGSADTAFYFGSPGNYIITYTTESDKGCLDTTNTPIVVNPNPKSSFTVNDTIQCANNNNFKLEATSVIDYGAISHEWYFDEVLFAKGKLQQPIFTASDTIVVMLVDISSEGCRDSAFQTVYIAPTPNVNFTINDPGQCLSVNRFELTNKSTVAHGTLSYNWSFGDGVTSSVVSPVHTYQNHGDYNIELIAESNWTCRDTASKPVLVHPEPTAGFTFNDDGQCYRENLFRVSNISTIDSTELTYKWSWGDGAVSVLENPEHTYGGYGTYKVGLVVSSNYNCMDSVTHLAVVHPMPAAAFDVNVSWQCINDQGFEFTNKSDIAKGTIVGFRWNIEGQNRDDISPIKYEFASSGHEQVTLSVVSDSGCTDTVNKTVRIFPKPNAGISVNDSAQCLFENEFVYQSISTDSFGVSRNEWFIDWEKRGSGEQFVKTYGTPGIKTVNLVSTSLQTCKDTALLDVLVKPMPDPRFEQLRSFYCEDNDSIILVPNLAGGTFSGKNIINQKYVPRILWEDTVKYVVYLDECVDSSVQYTNVYPLPVVDLGNDTTICKHEVLLLDASSSWKSSYVWQDKSTNALFKVRQPGKYFVTVTNICGEVSDSIEVKYRDINCRFFLPTAFTPKKDGVNDFYKPIVYNIDDLEYRIFNRWGELIYVGNASDAGWDGTYQGVASPLGYYLVTVRYSYPVDNRLIEETVNEVFYLMK